MSALDLYKIGTVSVTNGSKIVAGVGTAWTTFTVKPGDTLYVGAELGLIEEVNNTLQLVLATEWVGVTASAQVYVIRRDAAGWGVNSVRELNLHTAEVIKKLNAGSPVISFDSAPTAADALLHTDGTLGINVTPDIPVWYTLTSGAWVPAPTPGVVVNNLISDSTNAALSAKQGKFLKGFVDVLTEETSAMLSGAETKDLILDPNNINIYPLGHAVNRIGTTEGDWVAMGKDPLTGNLIPNSANERSPDIDVSEYNAYKIRCVVDVKEELEGKVWIGYGWIAPDGATPTHYYFDNQGATRLAAPLAVGDTTIELEDASGWNENAPASSKRVAFGEYEDALGNVWTEDEYTRRVSANFAFTVTDNTINLPTPWVYVCPFTQDGAWPAGQSIRQALSGSSYYYLTFEGSAAGASLPVGTPVGSYVCEGIIEGVLPGGTFPGGVFPSGKPRLFETIVVRCLTQAADWPTGKVEIADFEVIPVSDSELLHRELKGKSEVSAVIDGHTVHAQAALNRALYPSGILNVRQYQYNPTYTHDRRTHAVYAALSAHTHADHRHLVGLAEWEALWHGHYSRQRHTDYSTKQSIQGEYLDRKETPPPAVPAFVLAKPTGLNTDGTLDIVGDTQARWMSELINGQHDEFIEVQLSWGEFWLENVDEAGRTDAADSSRHADVANNILEEFEKNSVLDAGGAKYRLENLGHYPAETKARLMEDGSVADSQYAVNYRVNTRAVAHMGVDTGVPPAPQVLIGTASSHQHQVVAQIAQADWTDLIDGTITEILLSSTDHNHTHDFRITWDAVKQTADGEDLNPSHQHPVIIAQGFNGALPFDRDKARDGIIDGTNRFKMVLDPLSLKEAGGTREDLASSMLARFECVDLEKLITQCYGLEGEDAVLEESYLQPDGETQFFCDISDPNPTTGQPSLNAAKYNRRALALVSDASGRDTMHRGFSDPNLLVAKTTHERVVGGFSYAIPLEVIFRSPLESWNPANLTIDEADYTASSSPQIGVNNAYTKVFGTSGWNFTPNAIWGTASLNPDPADTPRLLWMRAPDGNDYQMSASGIWRMTPAGQRGTLPIYNSAYDATAGRTEQRVINDKVKAILQKIKDGVTLTQEDIDNFPT